MNPRRMIVPIEPTDEMIRAAERTPGMKDVNSAIVNASVHGFKLQWGNRGEEPPIVQVWRAMIHAAQNVGTTDAARVERRQEQNLADSWSRWEDYCIAREFRDVACRTLDKAEIYAKGGKPLPPDEIAAMTERIAEATQRMSSLGRPVKPHGYAAPVVPCHELETAALHAASTLMMGIAFAGTSADEFANWRGHAELVVAELAEAGVKLHAGDKAACAPKMREQDGYVGSMAERSALREAILAGIGAINAGHIERAEAILNEALGSAPKERRP